VARQIFAIGGGATPGSVNRHLLSLTGRRRPSVLLVNTAGREDPAATLRAYDAFAGRADVSRVEFFPWPPENLRELTLGRDLILVGGGLAGSSAGMICWFEAGVTDSFGPQLAGMRDGLGLIAGSACPHYDDEELRRPTYRRLIDEERFPPGYAADSGVGLHFVDGELAAVVSARRGAAGYRVEPGSERVLPPSAVLA
jgi:dipeptidase E